MKEKQVKIVVSRDGSHTLFRKDIEEHYHSIHGSIQESLHVFIEAGLNHFISKDNSGEVSILEIGFGTGLNALLTREHQKKTNCTIHYHGLEPHPLEMEVIKQLNFKSINANEFLKLHELEWDKKHILNQSFTFTKENKKLQDFDSDEKFDVVYYDAFAPRAQEEMWRIELFKKLYTLTKSSGILVTYCAKGQVRRDLQRAGFKMERIPGPRGKREMLRGTK